MIHAKDLRRKESIEIIPNDQPGYYKWWACRDEFDMILAALEVRYDDVASYVEVNSNCQYAIYVGIAAKESIRKRLDWHVNDKHTKSKVLHGTLSTLRQSISSIIARNQFDKEATDNFIDKLDIEYHTIDAAIGSQEAKNQLHEIERQLLAEHLYLINIQENHHPAADKTKKKLKSND